MCFGKLQRTNAYGLPRGVVFFHKRDPGEASFIATGNLLPLSEQQLVNLQIFENRVFIHNTNHTKAGSIATAFVRGAARRLSNFLLSCGFVHTIHAQNLSYMFKEMSSLT